MASVGSYIRTARLEAGISLEQICATTCIPVRTLRAIEDDDLRQVSSAFFYKSFVRQFCVQIGLPAEALQEAIAQAATFFPEPIIPGQGEALVRSTVIRPSKQGRQVRWLTPALSLAFVLVACSGFYAYWEQFRVGSSLSKGQHWFANRASSPSAAGDSPAIAQPKAVVPAEPDGGFRVELSAVERTWLSLRADGKQLYSGTLEVDQTKVLEGRQEGLVRTGNAGGVSIVFNGKPIGLAGPHGSTRTVVFTRNNYEVLPDPVHTALLSYPSLLRQPLPSTLSLIAGLLQLPPAR